jgi:replicative DNA helicase
MQDISSRSELERTIINNLLHSPELVPLLALDAEWFEQREYKQLIDTMDSLRNDGIPDLPFLQRQLEKRHPRTAWRLDTMFRLASECYPVTLEITTKSLLRNLQEKHLLNNMAEVSRIAAEYPSPETAAIVQDAIDELKNFYVSDDKGSLDATHDKLLDELTQDATPGIKTYVNLDYLLGDGLRPEQLIGIAGRPGEGKTAFVLNVAYKALTRSENNAPKIDIFSLEMSKKAVMKRMISIHTGIEGGNLMNPKKMLTDAQKKQYAGAVQFFRSKRLEVYDELFNFETIAAVIKRNAQKYRDNYLPIIDYLQLMEVNGAKDEYSRITELTRQLKKITGQYHTPIICLSQLNRGSEASGDKVPHLSNLRGSGSIEQDFSTVGLLYKQEDKNGDWWHIVNFEKNREGETQKLLYKFDKAKMQFTEDYGRGVLKGEL